MVHRKQDSHDLGALQQLDELGIRFLWHFDWWDGPLCGTAEYEGQRTWYDFHSDTTDDRHYQYVLYPLTPEQAEMAELWHATKGCWDSVTGHWVGRDLELHDESWAGPDFIGVQPIGWFIDGRNVDFYGIKISH